MADQQLGYRFSVEISGIQEALFTECSGFDVKIDVEEYKEGGMNDHLHKIPGARAIATSPSSGDDEFARTVGVAAALTTKKAKKEEKKNISIVLYSGDAKEQLRWNLIGAFPVKWTSPTIQTDQSAVMVESLELAFQEFTLQKR